MARFNTASLGLVIVFFVFPSMVLSAQYWVGDDDIGWGTFGEDYMRWAASKNFHVGDVLIFSYDAKIHNLVVAANSDLYEQCNYTPNLGVYQSGFDSLTLPVAGTYYFFCSYHCHPFAMKFYINVT
ncbi:putative cupredoxin [Rosa chinensis]|uniref:Putative cupredoxin n=1 Tax=Rosa chinensis TaxID=74649 RepID=A0A2P6SG96_ROSCH|nr:mavicyanin-like [Rosa chinensis]PRQ57701.1 putative cupredoxin [Rosa chinensis]